MSVIVEMSIFPLDKGESLSPYVSRAVRIIKESGVKFQLGPMGTCLEGEWEEVMAVVNRCFQDLKRDSRRIHVNLKVDYQEGKDNRLEGKVRSVEAKL